MAQQVIVIMYQIYGVAVQDILLATSQQLEIRENITNAIFARF